MIIRGRYFGLLAISLSVLSTAAFADDELKKDFDQTQSDRLKEIQAALATGNVESARSLARTQAAAIDEKLKDYQTAGSHQRRASSQFGSVLMTQEVVDHLKSFSMYEGRSVSEEANTYLKDNYGIELSYEEPTDKSKPGTWRAIAPSDPTKIKEFLGKNLTGDSKKIWDGLSVAQKNDAAFSVVRRLSQDLRSSIPQDGKLSASLGETLGKKSEELAKQLETYRKDISTASFIDESEKRLLAGEKKAVEALRDAKDPQTLTQFCEGFANGLDNPEDLRRRIDSTASTDPCAEPLKKRLASRPADAGRTLANGDKPKDEPAYEEPTAPESADKPEKAKEDSEGEEPKSVASKEKAAKRLKEQSENDAKNNALTEQVKQMQQAMLAMQGEKDTLQSALAMQQQCQRSVGSSSDPFGLNPDNQKNEKMIESLKSEMEKVLVDNYSATVCEQVAKGTNVRTAAQNIVGSLVPDGALTEADQKTLKGIAQGAIDQAGNFAKKRSTRMKLMVQMVDAASRKALTRLTMEYSTLLNTSTVPYLKSLSHTDLVGVDGQGFGGALSKASTNPQDPSLLIQTYNSLYEAAMLDLKNKYGTGEDYETNAECALTLAQEASSRWSSEAGRMTSLFGPARQSAYRNLSSLLGPTDVKNAPSSETKPKKNYRTN